MNVFHIKSVCGVSAGLSSCQLTESLAQLPLTTTSWWVAPTSCLTVDSIIVSWLTVSCLDLQVRPKVEFHSLLQHAGATKEVFTMKEVRRGPAPFNVCSSFNLPSCNCESLPAGDVLPGPVHHPEAAVWSEAAAHRPLLPRWAGPGSGSRQLLRQRAAVRFQFHLTSRWSSSVNQKTTNCLSFRVLFATIMKNLVAVKNQGETIIFSSSCCSSEIRSSSQTIIHNPLLFLIRFTKLEWFRYRRTTREIRGENTHPGQEPTFKHYWAAWRLNLWFQDAADSSSADRRSRRRRRRRRRSSCRSSDPGECLLFVKIKRCDAVV